MGCNSSIFMPSFLQMVKILRKNICYLLWCLENVCRITEASTHGLKIICPIWSLNRSHQILNKHCGQKPKMFFKESIEICRYPFNWQQIVVRKIQEYAILCNVCHRKTFHFFKELMAMPYLTKEWIEPVFRQISAKAL